MIFWPAFHFHLERWENAKKVFLFEMLCLENFTLVQWQLWSSPLGSVRRKRESVREPLIAALIPAPAHFPSVFFVSAKANSRCPRSQTVGKWVTFHSSPYSIKNTSNSYQHYFKKGSQNMSFPIRIQHMGLMFDTLGCTNAARGASLVSAEVLQAPQLASTTTRHGSGPSYSLPCSGKVLHWVSVCMCCHCPQWLWQLLGGAT